MKNDTTTTLLNFVLAALVILGVVFALMAMNRTHDVRLMQVTLQQELQKSQAEAGKAQQLLNDVMAYNAQAKSPELQQIIQAAQAPQPK
jgi:hypothetical protein